MNHAISERQGYGGYQTFRSTKNNMYRSPEIKTSLEKTTFTIWLVDIRELIPDPSSEKKDIITPTLSKGDFQSILGKKYSEYKIKKTLKTLVEKKLLNATGESRTVRYSITLSEEEGYGHIRMLLDEVTEILGK